MEEWDYKYSAEDCITQSRCLRKNLGRLKPKRHPVSLLLWIGKVPHLPCGAGAERTRGHKYRGAVPTELTKKPRAWKRGANCLV